MGFINTKSGHLNGQLLIEHVVALGIIVLAATWLLLGWRFYARTLLRSHTALAATYAAKVAVLRNPAPGHIEVVQVAAYTFRVRVYLDRLEVRDQNGRQYPVTTH